jgi:hypothetical protein
MGTRAIRQKPQRPILSLDRSMPYTTRLSGPKAPSPEPFLPTFFRIPRKWVLHSLPCLGLMGVEFPLRGDP